MLRHGTVLFTPAWRGTVHSIFVINLHSMAVPLRRKLIRTIYRHNSVSVKQLRFPA